jgi:serine/threonine protein kinase
VADVTRILYEVAGAVRHAHEKGVVHRDLKPQNILLDRDNGRAYVTDFGLARVVGAAPDLVQELADLVGRTESCISSICARLGAAPGTAEPESRSREVRESEETLERQLAVLEALLDKLRESDPISGVPGGLTADLEAAREICEVVEAMIEGKEWML